MPCETVELTYTARKFMNIACYCKDKAEHDDKAAKEQVEKIRRRRGR